ncbi:uncharacterized protein LOC129757376 [Uranotaenia lowii]|uniref:uncharacterized protein LOC129757376 n=1 Tax=Uranotaenia lowii TaxID=190385 RepID=UPI002479D2C5|nr:uncharacterized protein LOC129757376 [Uranotaenia lowii]
MRHLAKYSPLKSRSKAMILASSIVSNSFIRKYGIFAVVLCLGLGYLYYTRVLYQTYIYNTLPMYQKSLKLKLSRHNHSNSNDRWQPIGDPENRLQIYSAFFDPRLEIVETFPATDSKLPFGSVRIFTILPLNIRRRDFYCYFRYHNGVIRWQQADQVEAIHEHFEMPFAASYVVCALTGEVGQQEIELPSEVGVSYDPKAELSEEVNFVQIHYPRERSPLDLLSRGPPERGLAVCVGPAHHNYSNAARIVEFVELWRLLGAERFYFYNKSITPDVARVMSYYQNFRGIAQVQEWNLEGYEFEKEVRYEGIFAALNDCLYRATWEGDFRYAAMVDFDEVIFGFDQKTLVESLNQLDRFNLHSFNYAAVFFYDFFEEDFPPQSRSSKNSYLYSQVRNLRTQIPLMHHNRSKYVAKGRNVIEAGNHFVWKAVRDSKEYQVPEAEGLLFHYRDKCVGYGCDSYKKDNRARRFDRIWQLVDGACGEIFPDKDGRCPRENDEN